MTRNDKKIIILEGCDGAGKTTLGKKMAKELGYAYRHLDAFSGVSRGYLARFFMEAAAPALLGYQSVVMDRCWLSEFPYAAAYRAGQSRLSTIHARMLERVFLRCQVRLVLCHPSWDVCRKTWAGRKESELIQHEEQLKKVYRWYQQLKEKPEFSTGLDLSSTFDYTSDNPDDLLRAVSCDDQDVPNAEGLPVVGQFSPKSVLLVGEALSGYVSQNSYYRYPFVSFSDSGHSHFATMHLASNGISEKQLYWTDANVVDQVLATGVPKKGKIVALGTVAEKALSSQGLVPGGDFWVCNHPYHASRLKRGTRPAYDLADTVKAAINRSTA